MIGIVIAAGAGYVMGTKAGRRRYDQIRSAAQAVATNPATKAALDTGRRRLAQALTPDQQKYLRAEPIDDTTTIYVPDESEDRGR